jgi:hypothetical protein
LKIEIEDNEGTDIYTKEDLNDWDSTLMDGLEDEEWEDEDLQEPEIKVKMSGEPSLNMLSEEEARFDLNKDGVLDEFERTHYNEYKLLNTPGISGWRKKKIQDYLDGKSKRYF